MHSILHALARAALLATIGAASLTGAQAQQTLPSYPIVLATPPVFEGFLCCNMRSDGGWISDSNYLDGGKRVIPAGTPVKVTGYGHNRVKVEINGSRQAIGNDYSRNIPLGDFAKRYVIAEDARVKIAAMPAAMRQAIGLQRLVPGMTREQVLLSVGYPISSENPKLDVPIWRMWLSTFEEFQVSFDERGQVKEISAEPEVRSQIAMP